MKKQGPISSIWSQVRYTETGVGQLEQNMLGLFPDVTGGVSENPGDGNVSNGVCLETCIGDHAGLWEYATRNLQREVQLTHTCALN